MLLHSRVIVVIFLERFFQIFLISFSDHACLKLPSETCMHTFVCIILACRESIQIQVSALVQK